MHIFFIIYHLRATIYPNNVNWKFHILHPNECLSDCSKTKSIASFSFNCPLTDRHLDISSPVTGTSVYNSKPFTMTFDLRCLLSLGGTPYIAFWTRFVLLLLVWATEVVSIAIQKTSNSRQMLPRRYSLIIAGPNIVCA